MPEELSDEALGIPEGLDPNIRAELRKSRELARENEALKVSNETAARELAFSKAAIPDTPLGQMFAKAYEGPTDDPEAIKAAFQAVGGEPPNSQQEDADLEAQRRLAAVGGEGAAGGDVRFEDALGSAKNADAVMDLIAAAPAGATTYIEGRARRIGVPVIE